MNTRRLIPGTVITLALLSAGSARSQSITMSLPASTPVAASGTTDVAVTLSDGASVSAGQFTLSLSPTSGLEIVGVAAGTLLQPPASFVITTNPQTISAAAPTSGPLTLLIDSTGASMASGSGSLAILQLRRKAGCSGSTALTLSNARVTRNFASVTPTIGNGSATCDDGQALTLAAPANVAVDGTTVVPLQLNDGAGVSGGRVTLSLSPQTCMEVVGVGLGSLATPSASFTLTTNPQVISPASPAAGPVVILVDSTGASMTAGPGSFAQVSLRCKAGASCTPDQTTSLVLSSASVTRSLQTVVPAVTNGSAHCVATPETAVIQLGSTTARAGTSVDLPLTLTPSPDCAASSLTADIAFDTTRIAVPNPCSVTVGPAATGWSAQCNLVQAGLLRVVLFGSTGAMSQGTVATVRFDVVPGLAAGTAITLDVASCATSQAQPVAECPTTCVDGSVTVGGFPGDWNNDGDVLITELQKAVNCLLGRPVADGCGPADVNGNGMVSVVELQCVVNNFLDVVPPCTSLN